MGKGISTALGDAVNIAFGIEALTRVVDRPALVSAAFLDGWEQGRSSFESCGHHKVKGRSELIEVFALRRAGQTVPPL
jgi:class 3 adenylate cyclase